MILKFLSCFFLITVPFLGTHFAYEASYDFYSNPQAISSSELQDQVDTMTLDMCWQMGERDFFHFITTNNDVYFEILFDRIPISYDASTQQLFIENGCGGYLFCCQWQRGTTALINKPRKLPARGSNIPSYLVDERRVCPHGIPQRIEEADLLSLILNKNVLFYTGAGLSVASGVPSMAQLNDLLGLKEGDAFASCLEDAILSPDVFSKKIAQFHDACFHSPPSEAHQALAKMAFFKNIKIVTENLDCLHERSGILPYRIDAEEIRGVGSEPLRGIDYVICVGLSYDDRGFLGWYKKCNPTGKIIAINTGHPSYLGNEDFIIRRDLQELLPELANAVDDVDLNLFETSRIVEPLLNL